MRGLTADRAQNIGWFPAGAGSIWAVEDLVPFASAHPANGLVSRGAVDRGQFTQLFGFLHIVFVIDRYQQRSDESLGLIHRFLRVCCDQHVQAFVRVGGEHLGDPVWLARCCRSALDLGKLALFAADCDLGACLLLHPFLRVTTRTDNQTKEVVIGIIIDWDGELLEELGLFRAKIGTPREHSRRVEFVGSIQQVLSESSQLVSSSGCTRVGALAVLVVDRFGRRGTLTWFFIQDICLESQ